MRAVWALAGGTLVSGTLMLACTVETRSSGTIVPVSEPPNASPAAAGSNEAMLVDVDTNRTMVAQPGDGVGVFTEYAAGGHWHIFWTCDTNRTRFDCGFNIAISTSSPITDAAGESLDVNDALSVAKVSTGQLGVVAQTSTQVKGITFDTMPGTSVTLDAQLDGERDGRILFFVQDGQVNGGYSGPLADPITFEPSTP
jgi:hypothetical protein